MLTDDPNWISIKISQVKSLSTVLCRHYVWYSPFWPSTSTYWPTPWSRVLLEKLTGSHLIKKFPVFYGTRRFITVFTTARHLSLLWARSILILSSHLLLGISSDPFPSGFPTKTLYAPLFSSIRATIPRQSHSSPFCQPHIIWRGAQIKKIHENFAFTHILSEKLFATRIAHSECHASNGIAFKTNIIRSYFLLLANRRKNTYWNDNEKCPSTRYEGVYGSGWMTPHILNLCTK